MTSLRVRTNLLTMATFLVTDPRSDRERLRATKGHSVTGSCIWLFGTDDYLSWKDAGPQTLDQRWRWNFEPLPSSTLAYFFCDRNVPRLRTATTVLRGLFFNLTAYGRHQFSGTINGMFQHTRGFADHFRCRWLGRGKGLPQLLDFIGHTVT